MSMRLIDCLYGWYRFLCKIGSFCAQSLLLRRGASTSDLVKMAVLFLNILLYRGLLDTRSRSRIQKVLCELFFGKLTACQPHYCCIYNQNCIWWTRWSLTKYLSHVANVNLWQKIGTGTMVHTNITQRQSTPTSIMFIILLKMDQNSMLVSVSVPLVNASYSLLGQLPFWSILILRN